jgi:hypothetical protein
MQEALKQTDGIKRTVIKLFDRLRDCRLAMLWVMGGSVPKNAWLDRSAVCRFTSRDSPYRMSAIFPAHSSTSGSGGGAFTGGAALDARAWAAQTKDLLHAISPSPHRISAVFPATQKLVLSQIPRMLVPGKGLPATRICFAFLTSLS